MDYSIHSYYTKPEVASDAFACLSISPEPLDKQDLAEAIDKNEQYASAIIQLGRQLDIVVEEDGGYSINSDVAEEFSKASKEQRKNIVNQKLQRYKPFVTYLNLLNREYSSEDAARRVKILYNYQIDHEKLERIFRENGKYADLIEEDGDLNPQIKTEELPTEYIENLEESLKSEAQARIFVTENISEEAVKYMDESTIEDFVTALLNHEQDSQNAIVSSVRATEDFVRELAEDEGSNDRNFEDASGIGNLVQMMYGDDLVKKKHLHTGNYLGGMRNPGGGHGKDVKTLKRWQIRPRVALEVIITSLNFSESVFELIKNDKQIL